MSGWDRLRGFLNTDPADAGCDETFASLDRYAEAELAGADPAARFPGVAAHLGVCDPCAEDLRGLLGALTDSRDERQSR